jgi:hypothetical protein
MNLFEKYKEERDKFLRMESNFCSPVVHGVWCQIHPHGMKIETRSPGGSGDVVHNLYLTDKQALAVHKFIQEFFIDDSDKFKDAT